MTLLTGYYADKQNYGEIDLNACADNSKRAYIKYLKDLCKQSISLAKESLTHGHKKEAKNNLNKFYNYHKKLNKINPLSPLEFINYLKDQEIDIAVHKLGDIVTEINSTTGDKSFKTNNKLQYQKDYLIRYITDLANLKDNKSIAIFFFIIISSNFTLKFCSSYYFLKCCNFFVSLVFYHISTLK